MAAKWGFVPDFARLDIIYNYGGIYLDTDVELLKPLDALLHCDMYCGFESNSRINLGAGFGAVKGHPLVKKMADFYASLNFINADGSLNLTASPVYQTASLKDFGFEINNKYQVKDGVVLYPSEVFSPRDFYNAFNRVTDRTFSVHNFNASWKESGEKLRAESAGRELREILMRSSRL
jgi:hypothetical protein